MAEPMNKVPKRILVSLLESLSAGVVPRMGAPYVAIGRENEVTVLLDSLEHVSDGGSFMKLVIGRYGSGKSFLMQLVRGYAVEKGFVCCDADLSPERRFFGTKGNGVATYRELIKNMCTKTSPDGNAIQSIIAKWISNIQSEVAISGIKTGTTEFDSEVEKRIHSVTREAENHIGGFDFACVVNSFYKAQKDGDDEKKGCCLRWLRGEYITRSEAKKDLGVFSIINDENWYDYIKLLAFFVRKTGYKGLVVFIDECVNLYKITNRISRESNYEKLLSMFNDTLQGNSKGLGLVLGGTPMFLEDKRRGLYSYEALKSRLEDGKYSDSGFKNLMGPVIRLERLDDNQLYALVTRVKILHEQNYGWQAPISDEQAAAFLKDCLSKAGAETMVTPREVIRDFLEVLNILYQNKDAKFEDVVKNAVLSKVDENTNDEFDLSDIEL
ncbi:MAG: biotin carboxylase [Ruminococcaceae bacterium]|nr:biotin carboxylase [Oscillospiraceae bacterium]